MAMRCGHCGYCHEMLAPPNNHAPTCPLHESRLCVPAAYSLDGGAQARADERRAAYLAMAEECERLEAEAHLACTSAREPEASYHHGCGTQAGRLAAWARQKAGE